MADALSRFTIWSVKQIGLRTLLVFSLLLIAFISLTHTITEQSRDLQTGHLLPTVIIGLMIGWSLARPHWRTWAAMFTAILIGLGVSIVQVGQLAGTLLALLQASLSIMFDLWRWSPDKTLDIDAAPLQLAAAELTTRLQTLIDHTQEWLRAFASGQSTYDTIAATLVWSLALWVVAVWASWAVRRRTQALLAMTPAALLLAGSLSYSRGNPVALLPMLGSSLLLMALISYELRERRWLAVGADYSLELRNDTAQISGTLTFMLIACAALLSTFSVQQLIDLFTAQQREQSGQDAGDLGSEPLSAQVGSLREELLSPGLPREHLLGSGPELSRQVALVISTNDADAVDSEDAPRHYWRSLTYDQYTGHGWASSATQLRSYFAGAQAVPEDEVLPAHRVLRQTVQVVGDSPRGLLHAAGELLTVDQEYSVAWRSEADALGTLLDATTYRVDAQVSQVSILQLRASSRVYPRWVQTRYLDLPDTVPQRVLDLAAELTADALTPYDQARSIETYLRTFPYTLDLPAPPPDRDVADYFLFDLQKGYCDYYATAMVVLARAAGLPARLAMGYYTGAYDNVNARYVVTEADAHSWVEIYFPQYGWIEFEPTAGRPALERPETALDVDSPELKDLPSLSAGTDPALIVLILLLPLLAGIAFATWLALDGWRLGRRAPSINAATLYGRLQRHATRLSVPAQGATTPREFASALTSRVQHLRSSDHAHTTSDIVWLTDHYNQVVYSPHPLTAAQQKQAIRVWKRLRWHLWLAWLRQQAAKTKARWLRQ